MKLSTLKWWRNTSIGMMFWGILFYFVFKWGYGELIYAGFGVVLFLVTDEAIHLRNKSEK